MAKKFDTNPLDPDFPNKVRELETQVLEPQRDTARGFEDPADNEQQTRILEDPVFEGQTRPIGQPAPLMSTPVETESATKKLTIGNISLPENVLMALSYVPFAYIGLISAIVQLIFVPRTEPKVRYHAAQALAAHIGVWVVLKVLGVASLGSDIADAASAIFGLVTTIFLLIFVFKAWQGKPIHIETVESLTDWLEEKINPSK
ncbi:MAG: hypothetical protein R2684_15380 [Pyrinomonadaceae bacterium]